MMARSRNAAAAGTESPNRAPNPAKHRLTNLCEDDPEPPAGRARGTAATRAIPGSRAAGAWDWTSGRHHLLRQRCGDRAGEPGLSPKKRANPRTVIFRHLP